MLVMYFQSENELEQWECIRFVANAFFNNFEFSVTIDFNRYSSSNSSGCCSNPLDHLLYNYVVFAKYFLHVMFVNF